MLVDSPTGFMRVSMSVVVPLAVSTGLITAFLVSCVVKAHRHPAQTGGASLLDHEAVSQEKFTREGDHFHGRVFVHGEFWQARSKAPISDGETVSITGRDGLTLDVETNEHANVVES